MKSLTNQGTNNLSKGLATAIMVSTLGSAHNNVTENNLALEKPEWLEISADDQAKLTIAHTQNAIKAAMDWDKKFHCGRKVSISHSAEKDQKVLPNGLIETIEEAAYPGKIILRTKDQNYDSYNVVLHAMTHACVPEQTTFLPTPIPFSDGHIIGYSGLQLVVKLRNNDITNFTKIEEGMAERNAATVSKSYKVSSATYFAVGNITLDHFPKSDQTAHEFGKKNALPAFIRKFLGYDDARDLTSRDFEKVMTVYNQAWKNQQK
ncbi:hypothetical protein IT412_03335 [Candidatus Peregrinibacteria bacterium]|nr:hypothetical protein [Candidatus Peregrinibacteria bacterium]